MNKMRDWIEGIIKFRLRGHKRCNHPEALIRVFLDETSNEEKFKLLDHIFSCSKCSTEFPSLKELWSEGKSIVDKTEIPGASENHASIRKVAGLEIKELSKKRGTGRHFILLPKPLIATVSGIFLIALASILIFFNRSADEILVRTGDSDYFKVFSPLNSVSSSPILFQWSPVQNSKFYTLEILNKSLEPVFKKEQIKSESFLLQEDFPGSLLHGQLYFWKVISHLENGQTLESEFGKFTIEFPQK